MDQLAVYPDATKHLKQKNMRCDGSQILANIGSGSNYQAMNSTMKQAYCGIPLNILCENPPNKHAAQHLFVVFVVKTECAWGSSRGEIF